MDETVGRMVTEILVELVDRAAVSTKEKDSSLLEEDSISSGVLDSSTSPSRRSGRRKKMNYLSSQHQELRKLVRQGDPELLEEFIKKVEDLDMLNIRDEEGNSVLNEISSKTAQFVRIAEILIQYNADVNSYDGLGNSPLHNALLYYPATDGMVQLLLDNGASMQSKNLSGWTPIQMSDDTGLKTYFNKNNNLGPMSTLQKWLSQTNNTPLKGSASKTYKPLPDSPYKSILKGKRRNLPKTEESGPEAEPVVNRKRKRSSSGSDEEGATSKRIRFAAEDSLGAAIDPQFSEEEDD